MSNPPIELNRTGYAVAICAALALALPLLGGRPYAIYSGALLVVALLLVARAVRRTEAGDGARREEDEAHRDDDRERRIKEAEAEKTRDFGGGLG